MRSMWAAAAAVSASLALGGMTAAAQTGDAPDEPVFTCPPGTDPASPGRAEQARPPMPSHTPIVFDPGSGRIVAFPAGAGDVNGETWSFDVCTNTWSVVQQDRLAPRPPAPHALAFDGGSGSILGTDLEGQLWLYDPDVPGWEPAGSAPVSTGLTRLLYEPTTDRLMVARLDFGSPGIAEPRLSARDADTGRWSEVMMSGDIPDFGEYLLLASDPGSGTLVAYDGGSGRTWQLDPVSATWSTVRRGPALRRIGWVASGGEIAVDDAAGLVVVYADELVLGYDPATDTWQTLYGDPDFPYPMGPLARLGHSMAYDPVNERLVVMGGQAYVDDRWADDNGEDDGWVDMDDVWAFDTRTRTWRELLPRSVPLVADCGCAPWGPGSDTTVESDSIVEYAPVPTTDPSLVPDPDGFVFEDLAPGVRRLITDGAGHFPSATYIREARDMDALEVDEDGAVLVWSTTHGIDNELAGDRQLWKLGEEGIQETGGDLYAPLPETSSRVAPDGTSWSSSRRGGGVVRSDGRRTDRFLVEYTVNSVAITPDGRVWVAVEHRDDTGAIFVIEPGARGTRVAAVTGQETRSRMTEGSGSAPIPVSSVTLVGGPFFVRASDEEDIRRCSGFVIEAETIADGRFLSESQCWDEGAVWWEDAAAFVSGEMRATPGRAIELWLGGFHRLDEAIVQADDNDAYLLSYRDPASGEWLPLWTVPPAYSFGMVTRPDPLDRTNRQLLPITVTTDAVRLTAAWGDGMYSVSEIQLFGESVGD